eukprot:CAMPEP_0115743158 /NCGR_PEP_ID=MMETSP0272-20121206/90922_1 /TAXON_ID=71861 /ORGANISM="Scrippsiella trochoidea, Strain CCMP3099" /LENGTH=83 /DNA_ID=CAMNT_0003187949 /DNA_START=358 /DNA_END=609 /DNA_ORIENTATION=+
MISANGVKLSGSTTNFRRQPNVACPTAKVSLYGDGGERMLNSLSTEGGTMTHVSDRVTARFGSNPLKQLKTNLTATCVPHQLS